MAVVETYEDLLRRFLRDGRGAEIGFISRRSGREAEWAEQQIAQKPGRARLNPNACDGLRRDARWQSHARGMAVDKVTWCRLRRGKDVR